MENMPDDLITMEILSRLPVKSLLRLKTVCKSWRDVTKNPQFTAKHHRTRAALSNNGCILIMHETDPEDDDVRLSFVYDDDRSPSTFKLEEYPLSFPKGKMDILFFAPCNGIFCVALSFRKIVLWNPATREVKALPRSNLHDRLPPPPHFHWTLDRILGLSFDLKLNAYKVVRIWVLRRENQRNDGTLPRTVIYRNIVEVWTPNNKSWRQINEVPPVPITEEYPLSLKGRCYWRPGRFESQLVSFDMVKEVFQGIPLPDDKSFTITDKVTSWVEISILNEAIALINQPLQTNDSLYDVWLLEEGLDDGGVSWSKHVTIQIPISESRFLGFWKNGEVILESDTRDGDLVFLETNTGQVVETGLRRDFTEQIYVYNESLVSLKALDLV